MQGLKGKNVLVTGGSSGIGQAIAVRFAQEGANVAVNYYKGKEEADTTLEQMRAASTAAGIEAGTLKDMKVQADISKEADVAAMFEQVIETFGGLDILINNAGMQIQAPSHEIEIAKFDKMIDINMKGAFMCSQKAIAHFLQNGGGIIVNDSSVHELIPRPRYVGYTMSKSGMQAMTRTLALEYARDNIRINSFAPGATLTPINPWKDDPKKKAEIESNIPMGRSGTSQEMAAVAAFLASDDAAYITGQTLFVDGGLTLFPSFRTPWTG
ncbi:glucose 1-dehydrogenase [cf. Phormidesmis sp. LEGE 11477]|uniref:glucose 1-dehydrogenase n=1 Tax=cf. Phormidesmis sp. LEGE 11477 TaxID=1828680 RepID=UPI0018820D51|nr:glucose 1-dehydrogenase [cf. Phormidesmis sp. LEGE 11477]MBE9064570.1 glucose 1-dehydrogenase [cf. Phormidesmis sp. LEGE 11477]